MNELSQILTFPFKIKPNEVSQLQVNLIRSHACGVGAPMELTHARAMLILKTHNFLQGMSGVSRPLVETMLKFIENDIIPVIPRKGSVGAGANHRALAFAVRACFAASNSVVE